jgi:hypothetical protein
MSSVEGLDANTRFGLDQAIANLSVNQSTSQSREPITFTPCSLKVHHFADKFMDELPIMCSIIFMRQSIFLLLAVGDLAVEKPDLLNLALSMMHSNRDGTHDSDSEVATSMLLRQNGDDEAFTSALSARLAKAFKLRVFASCQFAESPSAINGGSNGLADVGSEIVHAWIEKRIVKELKQCQADGMLV